MASASDLKRKLDDERRTRPGKTVHADGATQLFDDPSHDEEAQAETVALTDQRPALERFEDALSELRLDSHSLIADGHPGHAALRVDARPDQHRTALAVLDRVRQQVGDDLIESSAVPASNDRPVQLDVQGRSSVGRLGLHQRTDVPYDVAQIDRRQVQ